jgi:hypothetical protein
VLTDQEKAWFGFGSISAIEHAPLGRRRGLADEVAW